MRLICPNCDAEYEVDDNAIPDAGRDVQCSNCGHAWFQAHTGPMPDPVEAEPARAADADDEEDLTPAPAMPDMPAPRGLDESLMAILKEEAEHELAARRAEAVPVEVQPDLGLESATAAARAQQIAVLNGEEPAVVPAKQATRRELLPDIEEINSTLRPSSAVRYDDDESPMMLPVPQGRSGFRSGFVLMLVLAAVLVALYLMAPRLAQQIPGAKGALEAYVAGVDQARLGLDSATKSVIAVLRRLAGSE
jgi:predicted Zn finger-like uncharacterized protein